MEAKLTCICRDCQESQSPATIILESLSNEVFYLAVDVGTTPTSQHLFEFDKPGIIEIVQWAAGAAGGGV